MPRLYSGWYHIRQEGHHRPREREERRTPEDETIMKLRENNALTPEIGRKGLEMLKEGLGLNNANHFKSGPSHWYVGVPGYGMLYTVDGKPISLTQWTGKNERAEYAWDSIPGEHQDKIRAAVLKSLEPTGTGMISFVDADTNTLNFYAAGDK
jgi:hypothetical protein